MFYTYYISEKMRVVEIIGTQDSLDIYIYI